MNNDSARRERSRLAGRSRRWPAVVLLVGGVAGLLAGASILIAFVAPTISGRGPETPTTAVQPAPAAPTDTSTIGSTAGQSSGASDPAANALDHPVDGIAFQMRVPAIGYSATVREGVDLPTLEYGPGHYPTTAWPGHPGIVGVAAHNIFWLRFTQLKPGDRIVIQTRRGVYEYQLISSEVTNPNDRTILVPSTEHRLVLTTCYPLWAGAFATQRLIFFTRQIGPLGRPA